MWPDLTVRTPDHQSPETNKETIFRTVPTVKTKQTRTVCQITKGYPRPALLIISLDIFWTGIILLHAHLQGDSYINPKTVFAWGIKQLVK